MLPRKNSTNSNPDYASPHPTSGSIVGGLSPDPVSDDTPIPPSLPPPLPPRPSPILELPRPSIRCNTYETFGSAVGLLSQSQLLDPMPTPSPFPPSSPAYPPPTHIRPGPPVLGDLHKDSGPLHSNPADIFGDIHADVWPTYNKISQELDKKKLSKWNADLEVLLIFAALFSAIVTAFLILALNNLTPNYQQQSALLLYQLLNGHDPNLARMSDPTAPFQPPGFAVAVNFLWFASLSASLGASFGAMMCKEWLTEYNGGANPVVGRFRACQRQAHFMGFQKWNIHLIIALLPPVLHCSVLLFFSGAVIYLWHIDARVSVIYIIVGGIFGVAYFISTLIPFVTNAPFRPYSTLLVQRLSIVIGKVVVPIVDTFAYGCFLALQNVKRTILWLSARTSSKEYPPDTWHLQARKILPGEYKHMRAWWENAFSDSLDEIDTSEKVQEEAILWLSQMPLDPSESKAVASSLARITSSRPHKFPKRTAALLNLALESSVRAAHEQGQVNISIDCVIVLGHIKYQSVVDQNLDQDHDVGGIPVTTLVAWAAQRLTANNFNWDSSTPHSKSNQARLLKAAAWLSPEYATEVVTPEGEKLKIQDRWEFLKKIEAILTRHVHRGRPFDNNVLISLVHGMHACIPRGNYGSASSIIPFLPLLCKDYDSPWSADESVLRTLITYALDLLLPPESRGPLVVREIEFDKLAWELIDELKSNVAYNDVVRFGFWLIYRAPYAFWPRQSMLTDIVHIWTLTDERVQEDYRLVQENYRILQGDPRIIQEVPRIVQEVPRIVPPAVQEVPRVIQEVPPTVQEVPRIILEVPPTVQEVPHIIQDDHRVIQENLRAAEEDLRVIKEYHKRMNVYAIDAFVAVAQCRVVAKYKLSNLATHSALNLLRAAPEEGHGRLMATYAVAMILNLSPPSQAATFSREVDTGPFTNALYAVKNDIRGNVAEENVLNLHIYSTLVLLKLPQPQVDAERVRGLSMEMENTIKVPTAKGSGLMMDPEANVSADLDRVRWKVIYLCGLLFKLLPSGEREARVKLLRERVQKLLQNGGLLFAVDYEHCIGPQEVGVPELGAPDGPRYTAFKRWIDEFPLFPLAGSISYKA